MKNQGAKDRKATDDPIRTAAVAAVAVGLIVTAFLLLEGGKESYSALYLVPGSYSNYLDKDAVFFAYGVQCFETQRTQYHLTVMLDDKVITEKDFVLDGRGKSTEDTVSFDIPPNTGFPAKVSVLLKANDNDYETHFWIKGRK
jgi:hypothetical protein